MKQAILSLAILSLALLVLSSPIAWGKFAGPKFFPAEKLKATTEARIKKDPKDAQAHYDLGRIHYQVFTNRALVVTARRDGKSLAPRWQARYQVYGSRKLTDKAIELAYAELGLKRGDPLPRDRWEEYAKVKGKHEQELRAKNWHPGPLTPADLQKQAGLALQSLNRAIELEPDKALFFLTRASLIVQYLEFLDSKVLAAPAGAFKTQGTLALARADFWRAYELSKDKDLEFGRIPASGLFALHSVEAAEAFRRLVSRLGDKATPKDTARLAEAKKHVDAVEQFPQPRVTPVVFRLRPVDRLSELLDPQAKVRFDLAGTGVVQRWSWVKPTTGFLVWDPLGQGDVRSGRTMFGSYTFRMPSAHGYVSMARLDLNLDGALTGRELEGFGVWFDRDQDGVSDPGEVQTVQELGIVRLVTAPTGREGASWRCERGLTLKSGTQLTTWDWVTTPLGPQPSSASSSRSTSPSASRRR